MGKLSVHSEIGRLRKVLVHSPGPEVDVMVPALMKDLLFDDILYGKSARLEHERFCDVLQKFGVETLDVSKLFCEALEAAGRDAVIALIRSIDRAEGLWEEVIEMLVGMSPATLCSTLIEGLVNESTSESDDDLYLLSPIPNLMFTRDPLIVVHDRVVSCSMAQFARQREAIILNFVFTHHPVYRCDSFIADFLPSQEPETKPLRGVRVEIEGGDLLLLDEKSVAIGWSERTSERAIEALVRAFCDRTSVEHLIMVCLPDRRSAMHLDTVFTRISEEECLVYPPMFLEGGREQVPVIHFDVRTSEAKGVWKSSFLKTLAEIGIRLNPIPVGGADSLISQQREQWTDGANAFCVAPGVILLYKRNVETLAALEREGYRLVDQADLLSNSVRPDLSRKTVIVIDDNELARARGGPRCLTHPLVRDRL